MTPGLATLARVLMTGAWATDRGRLLLTTLAIALGVALGTTVHLVNHSAAAEFEAAVRALSGDADLLVTGPRSGFDESLYPRLARHPATEVASPVLEIDAKLADGDGTLKIIGLDPFRALQLQPMLLGEAGERLLDLLRPGTVMLSESAARGLRLAPGSRLLVHSGTKRIELEVIAVVGSGSLRQPTAIMDIAAAQWAFERIERLSRIELRLRPEVSIETFVAQARTQLPPGVVLLTTEHASEQAASLSRAYRVNLGMLALVSLFTGAVLVFSTQSLSVLRRRTQLGLLRALGVSARALTGLLVLEAAALGSVGALAGLALGTVGAHLAIAFAGVDLGAGYFAGIIARTVIDARGLALLGASGMAASVLGGLVPAIEAARAEPARSLRAGDAQDAVASFPATAPALACLTLSALFAALPAVDGLPVFGYAAIALLLLGALLLMPRSVRTILHALPTPRAALVWLGVQQLRGASGYAGIGVAGMLASFGLVASMLIMIHSFRNSLDDWLSIVLPADLYVRAASSASGWIDADTQTGLAAVSGVERIAFSRIDTVRLADDKPPVALIARDIAGHPPEGLPLVSPSKLPNDASTPIWISEALRDVHGLAPGDSLRLPIAGAFIDARVAGIWRDYVRASGALVIPRAEYVRASGDHSANEAWIWLRPGIHAERAIEQLRDTLGAGAQIEIREPGRIRALSLAAFDRTFAVTYLLQIAAMAIGLFGVSIGTSAQALARRREFGVLHHLGLSRSELRRMVAIEGGIVGALGAAAGILVGGAMSLVLIHVINRQSFHWTMEVHVPWAALGAAALLLAACAAITASLSMRAALGSDVVRAVKEDW